MDSQNKIMTGEYVTLMETNEPECESWLYFIRLAGNEDNLNHLQNQLEQVDWSIMDDLSTFDLDLKHKVSATTAKEITKLELNSHSFHRKFDGVLEQIDLDFRPKDSNTTKLCKVFDQLGYGQIDDFIKGEDIDDEDLVSDSSEDSMTEDEDGEEDEEDEDGEEDEEDEDGEEEKKEPCKKKISGQGIPPALLNSNLPRFAKAKRKPHRKLQT
jgi:hypothetical protein